MSMKAIRDSTNYDPVDGFKSFIAYLGKGMHKLCVLRVENLHPSDVFKILMFISKMPKQIHLHAARKFEDKIVSSKMRGHSQTEDRKELPGWIIVQPPKIHAGDQQKSAIITLSCRVNRSFIKVYGLICWALETKNPRA